MARILITGSNSGFGLLSAVTLARLGHDVTATMRNPAKSNALDHAVAAKELSITKRTLDVADQASVDAALADAHDIDVLINNAGYEVQSSVEQLTDELMYGQLETNVMGPLRTMRAVLPSWRERGSGVIVNVSSIAGRVGTPYSGAYSASKWALEGLTEGLAQEVALHGIRVALIEPGIVKTAIMAKNVDAPNATGAYDRAYQRLFAFYAAGLMTPGHPSEVSEVIHEAATTDSPRLRYTCGWGGEELVAGRAAMSDEDWVALGALEDDGEYVDRFNELFGLDLSPGLG